MSLIVTRVLLDCTRPWPLGQLALSRYRTPVGGSSTASKPSLILAVRAALLATLISIRIRPPFLSCFARTLRLTPGQSGSVQGSLPSCKSRPGKSMSLRRRRGGMGQGLVVGAGVGMVAGAGVGVIIGTSESSGSQNLKSPIFPSYQQKVPSLAMPDPKSTGMPCIGRRCQAMLFV